MVGTGIRRVWRYAARLDVAAGIILIAATSAAIGSCFPQLAPTITGNPERLAAWMDGLRARHPSLADFLVSSGAVQFFHTPLFLIPWATLFLATLLCTLNRWRGVWRAVFRTEMRCADTTFAAAPYSAILEMPSEEIGAPRGWSPQLVEDSPEQVRDSGAPAFSCIVGEHVFVLTDCLREVLERRGFCVRTETTGDAVFLRADRNRLAPLGTLVTHLAVFLLLLGALLSIQFSWREELTVAPGQGVAVGHGTDLMVSNAGFATMYYPDGNIASYEAEIVVQQASAAAGKNRAHIRLNEPLVYRDVGFYLRGYATGEGGTTLTLLAAHDPGYGAIIAGGFLLFFAMTVTFTFPACRVRGRMAADGTVHLGGWAERQACGFEHEFAVLVAEVRDRAGGQPCRSA